MQIGLKERTCVWFRTRLSFPPSNRFQPFVHKSLQSRSKVARGFWSTFASGVMMPSCPRFELTFLELAMGQAGHGPFSQPLVWTCGLSAWTLHLNTEEICGGDFACWMSSPRFTRKKRRPSRFSKRGKLVSQLCHRVFLGSPSNRTQAEEETAKNA